MLLLHGVDARKLKEPRWVDNIHMLKHITECTLKTAVMWSSDGVSRYKLLVIHVCVRETDRQTDTQTDRNRDRQTDRHRGETDRQRDGERETDRDTERE